MNADLEARVAERTQALEAANEQLRAEFAERERTGEQIRQLQKMEALGQLTGGIAHDFNNLLTGILGGLEVTRMRIDDPRTLRLIDSSISAAQRGAKLIAQLMAFARRQNLRVEYLPLNLLIQEMRDLLDRSVGSAVTVTFDFLPDVWPVMADASQVQTAILNLAINARDAMPDGGHLRIATGNSVLDAAAAGSELAPGDYATLSVEDTGSGMSDAVKARLFEPFFTTKDVGKGTGLGLAQVYGFVRQSGGDVWVHSVLGEGTKITILLPRAAECEDTEPNETDQAAACAIRAASADSEAIRSGTSAAEIGLLKRNP
jgi:signal transduction histidine kinase